MNSRGLCHKAYSDIDLVATKIYGFSWGIARRSDFAATNGNGHFDDGP